MVTTTRVVIWNCHKICMCQHSFSPWQFGWPKVLYYSYEILQLMVNFCFHGKRGTLGPLWDECHSLLQFYMWLGVFFQCYVSLDRTHHKNEIKVSLSFLCCGLMRSGLEISTRKDVLDIIGIWILSLPTELSPHCTLLFLLDLHATPGNPICVPQCKMTSSLDRFATFT